MKNKILILAIVLLVALLAAWPTGAMPPLTNFTDHVHIQAVGGTATPALRVNQNGSGKIVEFSDGGTPVFSINNGGGIVASSILTQGAVITNLVVSAPTAVGTATPAAVIDNAGVSNLLEVRDAATPVFTVGQGGAVTGLVLQYGTAGQKLVCSSSTITGSGSVAHGLATPAAQWCAMNGAATGDGFGCSALNGSGLVTVSVWSNAATPAAATTPIAVNWCVIGTP